MSERPRVAPQLAAQLSENAPARLVRKIDQDPTQAEAWTWALADNGWTVRTTGGETVTLRATDGVVRVIDDIGCSCLLAPRCLHLLAVVSRLSLDESDDSRVEPEQAEPETIAPTPSQRAAAERLGMAAIELLERGALASGAVAQAQLLRATHASRLCGLHRLAQAGLRCVQRIRDLRDQEHERSSATLAADLLDILACVDVLSRNEVVTPVAIGHARRSYMPIGSLEVHGLFTEPVVSADGYAGVVTHVVDTDGRLWSVADVRGGDSSRVAGAYGGSIGLGSTVTHRDLGRSRLLIQGATGSAQGRLGSGAGVRAVRADSSGWAAAPVARKFQVPLQEQIRHVFASAERTDADPRDAARLIFLRAVVIGAAHDALLVACSDGLVVRCVGPGELTGYASRKGPQRLSQPPSLTRDNLRVLAQASGMPIRSIGRVDVTRSRTLRLLAVGPDPEAGDATPRLELPEAWGTTCNMGLDPLQRAWVHGIRARAEHRDDPDVADVLAPLRRRIHRVVFGGRSTLSPFTVPDIEREVARLRRHLCTTAADLLQHLATVALDHARTLDGRRCITHPTAFARAWLAAASYERAASLAHVRLTWSPPASST